MTKKKMVISIDVDDWKETYQKFGYEVVNEDDLIKLAKEGVKPLELARHTIVSRELDIAESDIVPPNKHVLNLGGAYAISTMFARRYKELSVNENNPDKTLHVRELVLQVGETDNGGEAVDSETEKGCRRAIKYLHSVVIGHIKSRLNIVAFHLGVKGVKENIQVLRDELNQLEAELLSVLE